MANKRKLIYGKGINDMPRGWISESELNSLTYDTWRHMILRTTQKYWNQYPTYEGTTVAPEWIYLSNFVEDVKTLPGYEEWAKHEQRYLLDKDVLGNGQKIYSKDTCCFLTPLESNHEIAARTPNLYDNMVKAAYVRSMEYAQPIKATHSQTGEVLYFESQKECGRYFKQPQANVWACLSDDPKYKSNKRLKKYYLEIISKEEYEASKSSEKST